MDKAVYQAGALFLVFYMGLSVVTGHPITIIEGISWFIIGFVIFYLIGLFTLESLNRQKPIQNIPFFRKIWLIFIKIGSILIVYPLCYLLFDMLKTFRDSTNKFLKDLRRLK